MGIPRFFRLAKPRQFHYEPIFYDERKERLQERIREIEKEMGIKADDKFKRTLSKGTFSSLYEHRKRRAQRYSTTRLIIILLFLFFIAYFIFFY